MTTTEKDGKTGTSRPQAVATNYRFIQLPDPVMFHPDLSPIDRDVYAVLLHFAWQDGYCYPSLQTIARLVGKSRPTIKRSIQILRNHHLLLTQQQYDTDGSPSSNVYTLRYYVTEGGTVIDALPFLPQPGLLLTESLELDKLLLKREPESISAEAYSRAYQEVGAGSQVIPPQITHDPTSDHVCTDPGSSMTRPPITDEPVVGSQMSHKIDPCETDTNNKTHVSRRSDSTDAVPAEQFILNKDLIALEDLHEQIRKKIESSFPQEVDQILALCIDERHTRWMHYLLDWYDEDDFQRILSKGESFYERIADDLEEAIDPLHHSLKCLHGLGKLTDEEARRFRSEWNDDTTLWGLLDRLVGEDLDERIQTTPKRWMWGMLKRKKAGEPMDLRTDVVGVSARFYPLSEWPPVNDPRQRRNKQQEPVSLQAENSGPKKPAVIDIAEVRARRQEPDPDVTQLADEMPEFTNTPASQSELVQPKQPKPSTPLDPKEPIDVEGQRLREQAHWALERMRMKMESTIKPEWLEALEIVTEQARKNHLAGKRLHEVEQRALRRAGIDPTKPIVPEGSVQTDADSSPLQAAPLDRQAQAPQRAPAPQIAGVATYSVLTPPPVAPVPLLTGVAEFRRKCAEWDRAHRQKFRDWGWNA